MDSLVRLVQMIMKDPIKEAKRRLKVRQKKARFKQAVLSSTLGELRGNPEAAVKLSKEHSFRKKLVTQFIKQAKKSVKK
jgi:hypothetical protein